MGTGTGPYGDLRYAITEADANPGSTIDFDVTGTIQLTSALPDLSADVTISGPGSSSLTVQGGGPSSNFRVFTEDIGVTASISGMTVTGGHVSLDGGGIASSGNLTLTDCVISDSTALQGGGGICSYSSAAYPTLTMNGCTVSGNTSGGNSDNGGGGIFAPFGGETLLMTDCTVIDNVAALGIQGASGGGAGINDGYNSATLTDCRISGNTTESVGGGILTSGKLVVNDCEISGNSAASYGGGGIYDGGGKIAVTGSTFSGNTATIGGAILNHGSAATLTNCTLSDNTAAATNGNQNESVGGAVANKGTLTITGCSITGNLAQNTLHPNFASGGGIYNDSELTLTGCTVSGNTAAGGGGICNSGGGYISGGYYGGPTGGSSGTAPVTYCTFSDNSATLYGGGILDLGQLTLKECVVSGNSSGEGGGLALISTYPRKEGLIVFSSQAILNECTLTGNSTATYGGGIFNEGDLTLTGTTVSGNTAVNDGGGLANISAAFLSGPYAPAGRF